MWMVDDLKRETQCAKCHQHRTTKTCPQTQLCIYVYIPNTKNISSHNHTASLLELAQNLGEDLFGQLLQLVRLLLSLLLSMLLLLVSLLVSLLVARVPRRAALVTGRGRHNSLTTSQVHVDATSVILSGILQPQLTANLLDARLDFLDVVRGVVSLADDTMARSSVSRVESSAQSSPSDLFSHLHMKVILPMRLGILDPLFQDLLSLLNELSVQIDGVCLDAPAGIVLAEDKLRRLSVILLHLAAVCLSLLGELLGAGAIAARVGFLRLARVLAVLK